MRGGSNELREERGEGKGMGRHCRGRGAVQIRVITVMYEGIVSRGGRGTPKMAETRDSEIYIYNIHIQVHVTV